MSVKFVSVESPFNSKYPWNVYRNIQYAIMANRHASGIGEVTYTPHIVNTQYVKYGINGYISDLWADLFLSSNLSGGYFVTREDTLIRTNQIRQQRVDVVVCYTDYGISSGMQSAIDAAERESVPVEYRKLPAELKQEIFGESFTSTIIPLLSMSMKGFALYGIYKCVFG